MKIEKKSKTKVTEKLRKEYDRLVEHFITEAS